MRQHTDVDILIRGWGNVPLTRALINSILANTQDVAYQIIYVDNGSPVDEIAGLLTAFPTITVVRLPFNHGSVRGINVGLQLSMLSDSTYVLLMDNDTEVPTGDVHWLKRWVSYFERDEKVAAAGAVSDYVSAGQHADNVPDRFTNTPLSEQNFTISFACMYRKSAMDAIGLIFDERFDPGNCEDVDYSIRLINAGWKNIIAESVWIKHHGSQTFSYLDMDALMERKKQALVDKWSAEALDKLGIVVFGENKNA